MTHGTMKKMISVLLTGTLCLSMVACQSSSDSSSGDASTSDGSTSSGYEEKLFGDNPLTIEITADQDDWDDMIENATSKTQIEVNVSINGAQFNNVAIKTKGNTSLQQVANSDSDRYSLKINFGKYDKDQTCYGLDKLVLNNIYGDSTYLKEYMSYALMEEMDVPSSLCNFAKITVNGEYYGFFLAIEDVDESFLERNYGSDFDGTAYKPESFDMDGQAGGGNQNGQGNMQAPTDGTVSGGAISGYAPTGTPPTDMNNGDTNNGDTNNSDKNNSDKNSSDTNNSDTNKNDNSQQTPPDMGDFSQYGGPGGNKDGGNGGGGSGQDGGSKGVNLVYSDDDIDSYSNIFENNITKIDEDDENRLIASLKGISEGTDLETYIDVDEVLRYAAVNVFLVNLDSYFSNMGHNYCLIEQNGQLSMVPWDYNLSFGTYQSTDASQAINYAIDTVFDNVDASERPIISKLLENETYLATYHKYLQQICDYVTSGEMTDKIDSISSTIDTYVKNDTTSFDGYDAFTTGVKALKSFCTLRAESVSGQLDGTIPSTTDEQKNSTALVDASSLTLSDLGGMSNGQGGMGNQGGNGNNNDSSTNQDSGQN